MIRALLDTNIILDALFAREEFGIQAAAIWEAHENELFTGYLSSITPVNVFYIARKEVKLKKAFQMVRAIMETFEVCPLDKEILNSGLKLDFNDFEDAVQIASAQAEGLDFIITRNLKDYQNSPIPALLPEEFLQQLAK
ncbi:MAG: PIN domain-containing protein [Chloroflexota bacterium]